MVSVNVIGSGVVGLSVAFELASRGANIAIIDVNKGDYKKSCSWKSGGMLSFYCESEIDYNAITTLGKRSIDWWIRNTGLVKTKGSLVLAPQNDSGELRRFANKVSGFEVLNSAGISDLEADLEGRFSTGLFFKDEAHINPRVALSLLAEKINNLGVAIHEKNGLDKPDFIIDCRGIAAKDKLIDLRGVKGEMMIIRCRDINLVRPVRILHPRFAMYIVPREENVFMVGSTTLEMMDDGNMTIRSAMEILSFCCMLHPAFLDSEILEFGVGFRPAFPDNLPRLIKNDNILYVNGLYRHGFLLSPALAEIVGDYLFLNKKLELTNEINCEW